MDGRPHARRPIEAGRAATRSTAFRIRNSRLAFDFCHDILPQLTWLRLRDSAASRVFPQTSRWSGSFRGTRATIIVRQARNVRMTQPAKSQEPSMEEILASIRRIIADDDSTKPAPRAPDPPKAEPQAVPPPAIFASTAASAPGSRGSSGMAPRAAGPLDQSSDILDLTESMAAMPPPAPSVGGRQILHNFVPSTALPMSVLPIPASAARRPVEEQSGGLFPMPPARRSIPPSIRWRRPC